MKLPLCSDLHLDFKDLPWNATSFNNAKGHLFELLHIVVLFYASYSSG